MSLKENIKNLKNSIVAIGIKISSDQVNIIGSGFCVIDNNHILTAAHLFQDITEEQTKNNIVCMVASKDNDKIVSYVWRELELVSREIENDASLLKLKDNRDTLLKPLELDLSDEFYEGMDVYYIGFPYAAHLLRDGFGITLIVNKGIISSIKRKDNESNSLDWLIVDGISNPGNSGCPLVDLNSNKIIGIMSISFRMQSQVNPTLDIREPMHIAGAKPISLIENMLKR